MCLRGAAGSGCQLSKADSAASVESVKAASDVYCPLDGEIVEGNQGIVDDPSLVNSESARRGLVLQTEARRSDAANALLTKRSYKEFVA
ncbi:hypothetical protein F2981_13885 [Sinorhizobium meliloti]|nr:hypothetical protein [Sinorhizobium meliloti]